MSMSWGGIIGSALALGGAGALASGAKSIEEDQAHKYQMMRDDALAKLAERTAKNNAEMQAKVSLDNVAPMAAAKAAADEDAAALYGDKKLAREDAAFRTRAQSTSDVNRANAEQDAETAAIKEAAVIQAKADATAASMTDQQRAHLKAQDDLLIAQAKSAEAAAREHDASAGTSQARTGLINQQTTDMKAGITPTKGDKDKEQAFKKFEGAEEGEMVGPGGVVRVYVGPKPAHAEKFNWTSKNTPATPATEGTFIYRRPDGTTMDSTARDAYLAALGGGSQSQQREIGAAAGLSQAAPILGGRSASGQIGGVLNADTGTTMPEPKSVAEAMKLPPGTKFRDTNGVIRTR